MDALLERLAPAYYALAVLAALFPSPGDRSLAAAGVALVGLAAAAEAAAPPASSTGFTSINELIALSGMALVALALWFAVRRTGDDDASIGRGIPPGVGRPLLDPLLLGALVLTAWAPHLLLLGLGAALALGFAARTAVRAGRIAVLVVLVAAGLCLGTGLGLLLTILGSAGGQVADVAQGPTSLAAERLLTLVFGAATLLLAGLPPLHRVPWGRQLAPLAAILLGRVVTPGFPAGLLSWQAAAMLLLAAGTLWSALRARWAEVAVGGGLLALWSGVEGVTPGGVLVAWGWLVETGTAVAARRGVALAVRWRGILALPAALAALPALTAGLRAQVLLSVATVAACVAGLVVRGARRRRPREAPLY